MTVRGGLTIKVTGKGQSWTAKAGRFVGHGPGPLSAVADLFEKMLEQPEALSRAMR